MPELLYLDLLAISWCGAVWSSAEFALDVEKRRPSV